MIDGLHKNAQFDSSAQSYDDEFTHSKIGKAQRERVYYWLNRIQFFSSKKNVFEINCGTGFDAEQFHQKGHQVFATDISSSMIAYAKENRSAQIKFETQSFQQVSESLKLQSNDVIFSNFGGLNCINEQELTNFFSKISTLQKKGNQLILVMMSKRCLMESLYFLLKFQFTKINRRSTNKGIDVNVKGENVITYYYTPKEVTNLLNNNYNISLTKPVAFFLPPSYLEPFFNKRGFILYFLNKLELFLGQFSIFAKWSDHYIIVAEKK